jgi:hypothetical protein
MIITDDPTGAPGGQARPGQVTRNDGVKWYPRIQVHKYAPDTVAQLTEALGHEPNHHDLVGIDPDEVVYDEGNQMVTVGLTRLGNLFIGSGAAGFTAAQAILGVGSSATAWGAGQTALLGDGSTTTAWYQGSDATPTNSSGVIAANATVTALNGNFVWNEWCWGIATGTLTPGGTLSAVGTSPVMLNRKVAALGTKSSGAIWVLQSSVTFS